MALKLVRCYKRFLTACLQASAYSILVEHLKLDFEKKSFPRGLHVACFDELFTRLVPKP